LALLGPGISQRAAAARTQTVWRWLVTCGPIGLGRYAQQDRVRVKPGETYRQPQARAARFRKLQASSLTTGPG